MHLEQKRNRTFEKTIESVFQMGRGRRPGWLVVACTSFTPLLVKEGLAREPDGGLRNTSCHLYPLLLRRRMVALWVSVVPPLGNPAAQDSSFQL